MKLLLTETRGSVIVEAAFIFSFLSILTVGCMEYGFWYAGKSQIDRVSYSLSSLIRERSTFYNKKEQFSKADVQQLYEMAKYLTGNKYNSTLCVRVEGVYFQSGSKQRLKEYKQINHGSNLCNNITGNSLKDKLSLATFSNRQRWMPLYQVTLVVGNPQGALDKLLNSVGLIPAVITSYNVVLVR
ncbi:hypothetical protein HGT71_14635 [Rosenbergiella epipactidis]|uniref:tight adherence pilus pseudopilin TadF n=1 Tax=Rosenbergiella epipactidis TaxID=1544694 RepID=UPI001BDAFA03|nr:hypothetical protein [Rosenbergiella epipactidis]